MLAVKISGIPLFYVTSFYHLSLSILTLSYMIYPIHVNLLNYGGEHKRRWENSPSYMSNCPSKPDRIRVPSSRSSGSDRFGRGVESIIVSKSLLEWLNPSEQHKFDC